MRSAKFIKFLKDCRLLEGNLPKSEAKPRARLASAQSRSLLNEKQDTTITKVQADLLFKRHTGLTKKVGPATTPQNRDVSSSFAKERELTEKKEQMSGLNRMDFETFVLALTDIATTIYQNYYDELQGAW